MLKDKPSYDFIQKLLDDLIRERAPGLLDSKAFSFFRPLIEKIYLYEESLAFIQKAQASEGSLIVDRIIEHVDLDLIVQGAENIPQKPCLFVANHPTGIADAVALSEVLRDKKLTCQFFGNSDIVKILPKARSHIIPVNLLGSGAVMTKKTVSQMREAVLNNQSLMMFPAGHISYLSWRGLKEHPWKTSFVNIAQKFNLPIIPVHISAHNSLFFYCASKVNSRFSDIAMMREALNKKGKTFTLSFGKAIDSSSFTKESLAPSVARIQDYIESSFSEEYHPQEPKTLT